MSLESALRTTEILVSLAVILQNLEHLQIKTDAKWIPSLKIILGCLLAVGLLPHIVLPLLFGLGLYSIREYHGPYNGGSDRMTLLVLLGLTICAWAPSVTLQEMALAYLALQTVLSYFVAGLVKVKNRDWLSGKALQEILQKSNYPVSKSLRAWGASTHLMRLLSLAMLAFELVFPLALLNPQILLCAISMAFVFHLTNAIAFGLNRFLWIWLAAYPVLIWFQSRFFVSI